MDRRHGIIIIIIIIHVVISIIIGHVITSKLALASVSSVKMVNTLA